MKRAKSRPLTPRERWEMRLLFVLLASCVALSAWIHLRHHEFLPPTELIARAGTDVRFPVEQIAAGKARIIRIEGVREAPIRLFAQRSHDGKLLVLLADCRRCNRAARPNRVREGRLICGHCDEPMPLLAPGAVLPNDADCTPIPIAHTTVGSFAVVRLEDIESGLRMVARN